MTAPIKTMMETDVRAVVADWKSTLRRIGGNAIDVTASVPGTDPIVSERGYTDESSLYAVGVSADLAGREMENGEQVELHVYGASRPQTYTVVSFSNDGTAFTVTLQKTGASGALL